MKLSTVLSMPQSSWVYAARLLTRTGFMVAISNAGCPDGLCGNLFSNPADDALKALISNEGNEGNEGAGVVGAF